MSQPSESINVFLVNGQPDSLTIYKLSNWNCVAVKLPRDEVYKCNRAELSLPGVYYLICDSVEQGRKAVYVGESDNIRNRLRKHLEDYKSGKEKYYWQNCVCFVSRELNKTKIRFLERHAVELGRRSGQYDILTNHVFINSYIAEEDKASMEIFLEKMNIVLSTIGISVLSQPNALVSDIVDDEQPLYFLKTGSAQAIGEFTEDGQFMIHKGARIHNLECSKAYGKTAASKRTAIIESSKVEDYLTTEDIFFSSPSGAADFILGFYVNGREVWKDKNGLSPAQNGIGKTRHRKRKKKRRSV